MGQFFFDKQFFHTDEYEYKNVEKHYWQYHSFLICSEFWNQFIENQTNLGSNMEPVLSDF